MPVNSRFNFALRAPIAVRARAGISVPFLMVIALVVAMTTPPVSAVEVEYKNSAGVLPSGLPFSEAVRVGDTLYLSGQLGARPGELSLVEGGIEPETRQTLENLSAVLDAAGLAMSDVVKCLVMLDDIADWPAFNRIYAEYFSPPYPARSAFATDGLALGARVELECIAAYAD